jgi:hypothetical protein
MAWFLIDIRSSIQLLKKAQGNNGDTHVSSQNKEVPMIPSLGTNTNGNNMDANNVLYNQK